MPEKPQSKTEQVFASSQQRDEVIKQAVAKEKAATLAKMAKLRTLRLAKEATEREAAQNNPVPPSKPERGRQPRKSNPKI